MARKDDLPEMIVSAARYAFSNMTALLIGGIVIALSFLIIGLPFFLGIYHPVHEGDRQGQRRDAGVG